MAATSRSSAKVDGKDVKLTVTGVSAHSSEPESGVNPVARMLDFINSLDGKVALKHNHITDAARYAADNWGLDYLGNKLGVGFSDAFMGPLTTSLTYVGMDDKAFKLAVNLRVPKGKSPEALKAEIADKLAAWSKKSHITPWPSTIRSPSRCTAILRVNGSRHCWPCPRENLGMEHKFGTSAGATSVHELPNGVQFGLARPERQIHRSHRRRVQDRRAVPAGPADRDGNDGAYRPVAEALIALPNPPPWRVRHF